jgi:hypothetical protein
VLFCYSPRWRQQLTGLDGTAVYPVDVVHADLDIERGEVGVVVE